MSAGGGGAATPDVDVDSIISRLIAVKTSKVNTSVMLSEKEVRGLVVGVREVFMSQSTLLEIGAPLNVVGDIHGQYYDLLRIFDFAGFPPDANYIFLGNYVDKGRYSMECICLLFAYKIKYPEKVWLLRGNHECAHITRIYGFYEDCKRRYNIRTWRAFNDTFNCMPYAAIIDKKILCVHSGLSPELDDIEQIRSIQRPTEVPDQGMICDLLWALPDDAWTGVGLGWGESGGRGSISYEFGANVVERFAKAHDFDLIVRGHQVTEGGYEFFAGQKLVTLFSAVSYLGEFDNCGAIMHVDDTLLCSFQVMKPEVTPRPQAPRAATTRRPAS